jgi:hypothetical protein
MNPDALWNGVMALVALGATVWLCFNVGVLGVMVAAAIEDRLESKRRIVARLYKYTTPAPVGTMDDTGLWYSDDKAA